MKRRKTKIIVSLIVTIVMALVFSFYKSVDKVFSSLTKDEFRKQPVQQVDLLTTADIEHLPAPVRKYIISTGAIGKPRVHNMRIEFYAEMLQKPGAKPMESGVVQYSFFDSYARIFYLKTSMFMIPARVLHAYTGSAARMWVRIASLFDMVNLSGPDLSKSETVTILNDICVLAPSCLIDQRLTWQEIDSLHTGVTFRNGPYTVNAILVFNEKGELVDFESDDRPPKEYYGTKAVIKWTTPLKNYKDFNGFRLATQGEAVYHYPKGNFTYGIFIVRKIEYNVPAFRD